MEGWGKGERGKRTEEILLNDEALDESEPD